MFPITPLKGNCLYPDIGVFSGGSNNYILLMRFLNQFREQYWKKRLPDDKNVGHQEYICGCTSLEKNKFVLMKMALYLAGFDNRD